MTEQELRRAERAGWPSGQKRNVQKAKLRNRYRGRLPEEIKRTRERLEMLLELQTESEPPAFGPGRMA